MTFGHCEVPQKWVGRGGGVWVCSQRYRTMITVVYFISGFITSFGTIFLRKVATFFYGRSPLWLQTKNLWKKKKQTTLLGMTWDRSLLATTSLLWDKLPHDGPSWQLPPYYEINCHMIVSSVPWLDDGTPTPNRKKKKFLPFPLAPKPKKEKNWSHWLHTEPSSVPAWNFYYGPIPLHNRVDTYSAMNRAEWAIPWNSGVLQFKKGPHPPPSLCLRWMEGRMDDGMDQGTDG